MGIRKKDIERTFVKINNRNIGEKITEPFQLNLILCFESIYVQSILKQPQKQFIFEKKITKPRRKYFGKNHQTLIIFKKLVFKYSSNVWSHDKTLICATL